MPVPRLATAPVDRPSGLVPPPADLSGVTEIRLHGVGGATPENLLGDLAPQQVAGDRIAGFYRSADQAGRHVEAYSWGGLTSQSGSRVLWVLLFPFALANVAGWMCTRRTHRSPGRFRLHRTATRWASLGLTVNLVLIVAMTSMDLIGYQCGGEAGCVDAWWFAPLRGALVQDHPARRVLLAASLPLLVLALLALLTLRSIRRYEQVPPPLRAGERLPSGRNSAAQPGSSLADRAFWNGRRAALDLGLLHLSAGFAVLAMLLAHTAHTVTFVAGLTPVASALWVAALSLGAAVLAGVLVLSALDECPRGWPAALLIGSVAALTTGGWLAAVQPASPTPAGVNLPGLQNATNLAFVGIFTALVLLLASAVLGGWEKGGFRVFGPLLLNILAVASLNAVLLSVLVSTDRLLDAPLAIYPVVLFSLPYLVLVPLVVVLLFGGYQLWTVWRAGRSWPQVKQWYDQHITQPEAEPRWQADALDARAPARARRWARRVAWVRRLAQLPRTADALVTLMVAVGVAILIVLQIRVWIFQEEVWSTSWTRTVSAYLGLSVPVLVLLLLRRGWRSVDSRRRIGTLWDVFTFWPRAYHPMAPPSYAERAVPELQRRIWRIHESGGRVVLAAHSQGSVIAAAALLQPDELPPAHRTALVSFGSPLGTLYGWAFPAYFGDEQLRRLVPGSGSEVALHGWRNFHYLTDYIGRRVLTADPPAQVDVELPDPPTNWYIFGQPPPRIGTHSGYWVDPAVWQQVDQYAADPATPASP